MGINKKVVPVLLSVLLNEIRQYLHMYMYLSLVKNKVNHVLYDVSLYTF